MHARLGRWAEGSEAFSQRVMLRRRKLFDVEKGYDEERRKVVEAIEYAVSMWARCASSGDTHLGAAWLSCAGLTTPVLRFNRGCCAPVYSETFASENCNLRATGRTFPDTE